MTPPAYRDEMALELAKRIAYSIDPTAMSYDQVLSTIQVLLVEEYAKIEAAERERVLAEIALMFQAKFRALKDSKP